MEQGGSHGDSPKHGGSTSNKINVSSGGASKSIKCEEIAPRVFLYTLRSTKPTSETYFCEVAKFENIEITLTFEGSENIYLEDAETKMEAREMVPAFERVKIAKALIADPYKASTLVLSFSLQTLPFENGTLLSLRAIDDSIVNTSMSNVENIRFPQGLRHRISAKELTSMCKEYDVMFYDKQFPPLDVSLGPAEFSNQYPVPLVWRRAHHFMDEEYQIFSRRRDLVPDINIFDMRRSTFETEWILSALIALAEKPHVLDRKLFSHQPKTPLSARNPPVGLYHVTLYAGGIPRTMALDDFFPCTPNGGPVIARSHKNELWLSLCEKGMAKYFGGYDRLERGWVSEALSAFTGCPTCVYHFKSNNRTTSEELTWQECMQSYQDGNILTLSCPGEDIWTPSYANEPEGQISKNGLLRGFSYPILRIIETKFKTQLMCLRNVDHKDLTWNSRQFAPGSEKWDDVVREATGMPPTGVCGNTPGEFWVTFDEAHQYFQSMTICRLYPADWRSCHQSEWKEIRRRGFFSYHDDVKDVNKRVQSNLYILDVEKDVEAWITMHQASNRAKVQSQFGMVDMGFTLLELNASGEYVPVEGGYTGCAVAREQMARVILSPGHYVLVPVSTGTKFFARTSRKTRDDASKGMRWGKEWEKNFVSLSQSIHKCLEEMFDRLDGDMDGLLSKQELDEFMLMSEGKPLDDETYQWLQQNFTFDNGGLTCSGFVSLYNYMLDACNGDNRVLAKDLEFMGYDEKLQLKNAATFVFSIHYISAADLNVTKVDFDKDAFDAGLELPIVRYGKSESLGATGLQLHSLKARGGWGISFVVTSATDRTYIASIDCHGSVNVDYHGGKMERHVSMMQGERRVIQHLMPIVESPWSWSYRMSWEATTVGGSSGSIGGKKKPRRDTVVTSLLQARKNRPLEKAELNPGKK